MAVAKHIITSCDQEGLTRRNFISGLPLAGVGLSMPQAAEAEAVSDFGHLVEVIEQLEDWQDWEQASVVAAKAFVLWQIRKALNLPLPDAVHAQMHVDDQRRRFEDYQQTSAATIDREAGHSAKMNKIERSL
jgi:hypothetical protein